MWWCSCILKRTCAGGKQVGKRVQRWRKDLGSGSSRGHRHGGIRGRAQGKVLTWGDAPPLKGYLGTEEAAGCQGGVVERRGGRP